MRIHERERLVNEARRKIIDALDGLTYGEAVRALSSELATTAKYMIREERHGDADTPGGLAPDTEVEDGD